MNCKCAAILVCLLLALDTVGSFVLSSSLSTKLVPNSRLLSYSPLKTFNDWFDRKLENADDVTATTQTYNDDYVSTSVFDFDEIMWMAFDSAISLEMKEKRRKFAEMIQRNGGYCVIQMQDPERTIMNDLWNCMDSIFSKKEKQSTDFRHQTLTRDDTPESHKNSGYEFFQTSLADDSIPRLVSLIGKEEAHKAVKANQLLCMLGKAVASIIYAGVYDRDPKDASDLMTRLLDEDRKPFSGSFHRLARYKPVQSMDSSSSSSSWSESLRSHGDWSLITPIPVSSITGLEVYNNVEKEWIRPEVLAKKSYENGKTKKDNEKRWNAQYVTVMVGKWMELLTNGHVETCIHKVVSQADLATTRMSAPLFMRPKAKIFDDAGAMISNKGEMNNVAVRRLCTELIQSGDMPGVDRVSQMAVDMAVQA